MVLPRYSHISMFDENSKVIQREKGEREGAGEVHRRKMTERVASIQVKFCQIQGNAPRAVSAFINVLRMKMSRPRAAFIRTHRTKCRYTRIITYLEGDQAAAVGGAAP